MVGNAIIKAVGKPSLLHGIEWSKGRLLFLNGQNKATGKKAQKC